MKYKFILKYSYNEIEFVFDDFEEGCTFMNQALFHAGTDITFVVRQYIESEGEADETV